MSKRTILICAVTAIAIMAMNYDGNVAVSKSTDEDSVSIGVVSVKLIFDESKRNESFKAQLAAEQDKIMAEMRKSRADIEADSAGLKTLKQGSSEYMAQMKTMMEKQAKITAEQEFVKQKMALQEREWIETTYNDILRFSKEVAQQRGLDIVMENSEVELANVPDDMLVMSILMRTVVYAEGSVDITDEVMAKIDSSN